MVALTGTAALWPVVSAEAAIVYIGASSGRNDNLPTNGSAGALTIARPVGVSAGDVLIATIAPRPRSTTVTVPSGWTQMTFTNQPSGGPSTAPGGMSLITYYRVVSSTESANYTWTFANLSNGGGGVVGGILAFSGVDTTSGNPIDGAGTVWSARLTPSSLTHATNSITTTVANTMIVSSISYLSAGNFANPTSSGSLALTERVDQSAPLASTAIGVTLQMSTVPLAAIGATGTTQAVANAFSDTGVTHLMALKPSASPVAEFRFDECTYTSGSAGAIIDSSTNARHGTPYAVTTPSPAGQINRALGLAAVGTSDYASLNYAILNGATDFSMSIRFKTAVSKSQQEIVQALGTSSTSNDAFEVYLVNSNQVVVNIRDSSDIIFTAGSPGSLTDNVWHQLAVTRNGSSGCLYIDGALVSCNTGYSNNALALQSGAFLLGQEQDSYGGGFTTSQAFEGLLDELKFYDTALSSAQVATIYSNENASLNADGSSRSADSCSAPDHYELSLPSSSLACLTSTVTVTACANSTSPCTSAETTLSGQTAMLSASGGALGATTVSFNGSGVATTTLSYPSASDGTPVSVTLSGEQTAAANPRQCCLNGTSCSAANSCSTTFNTAGFIVAGSADGSVATIPTQTAGTASSTYYLRAVRTSTTTKACEAALAGSTAVNFGYECNNPTTCSGSNLMTVNGGVSTTIARNDNGGVTSYLPVTMSFDANGNAPFSFNYSDVGQITLYASKSPSGSLLSTLTGSSNAFVTQPGGFVLSGIQCTTHSSSTCAPTLAAPGSNPAAADATGAAFIQAGESFSATVTATTSGGVATPNYGREVSPEGVRLAAALVQPGGGNAPALVSASAFGSFTAGAATGTTFNWPEVGIITLTPSVADADYLGTGNVTGTTSGNVGRFIPANFALSAPSVTQRVGASCLPASTFTYLGENFGLGFTLTARNASGATTTNYQGSFAKLDPTVASNWQLAGIDASTVFSTGGAARLSLGLSTGSWSNGVAAGIALGAAALRDTTPDGPFNAVFGIAPNDSDGVLMSAYDLDTDSPANGNDRATVGTVPLRFGRLRLANAIGTQDRNLGMPVQAQYWNGSAFATNTLDSCTQIATTAVNFGNYRKTITNADTAVSGNVTLTNGVGILTLIKPTGGQTGTFDVALSLGSTATDASCLQPWTPGVGDAATLGAGLSFLRGAWCGSTNDKDPSARASFGLYRGADNLIYQREHY